jgi:hypothetical protein
MRWRLFLSSRTTIGVLVVVMVTGPSAGACSPSVGVRCRRAPLPAHAPSVAVAVVPVTAARIADSRVNQQIIGGAGVGHDSCAGHREGGVPGGGVAGVVLTLTVMSPQQAAGYITVWPSGIDYTDTSNLNCQAGQHIPNSVIIPMGQDGNLQLFNGSAGTVHLLVDVTGYTLGGDGTPQSVLNAVEGAGDAGFVPSTVDSVPAATTKAGFRMRKSFLGHRSPTTITNATTNVRSGTTRRCSIRSPHSRSPPRTPASHLASRIYLYAQFAHSMDQWQR